MRTRTLKPYLAIILTLAWSIACVQAQFTFTHIGTGETGSVTPNSEPGSFTLIGGGDDIWDATDNFDFAHAPVTGNFDYRVRVESLEFTAVWTKAGLMAREALTPDSRMAFNRVTPSSPGANDTRFSYRTGIPSGDANGGRHEDGTGAPGYPNAWLRLERVGAVINGYASTDGLNWRLQGSQDTVGWQGGAVAGTLQVGLAVSRHSGADPLATCEFRDLGEASTVVAAISTQPANTTAEEGFTATFRFSAPGGFDLYDIQWRKNGEDIAGANGISYTTPALAVSDSGATYSVAIRHRGNGSTATSGDATLTVVPDTSKPSVVSIGTTPGISDRAVIVFSEPVNESDAENLANYNLTGATATGATLQGDNKTVHLATSPLSTSSCKELTVSGIRDRAATPNTVDSTTKAFIYADGALRYNEYHAINGGAVSDLTSNAKFPNSPDVTSFITDFENPNEGAGQGDNYGGRMVGYLTPAISGAYTFYIAADDGAVLYLSTDEDPANKVAIATEPIWSGFRTYTGEAGGGGRGGCAAQRPMCNISLPVNLTCGNRYYVEALWKEGGGGDHMSVAWQPPGAGVPTGPITAEHLSPLNATAVTLAGTVPADTTISENQPLLLQINITAGTPTFHIQWYKNGNAIPGATGTSYSIDNAKISDSGNYHATVQNGMGLVSSRTASVTVIVDTIAPGLVSAIAPAGNANRFDLIYTEPVNEADAENLANYSLPGVTLASAELQADNKTVRITTSTSLHSDGCKILTVNNVRDRAIPPNTLNNGTVGVAAAKGSIRYHQFNGIGGVLVNNLTSNPKFPNFPDRVLNVNQFENPEGADDNFNDYGAQFIGFVHPPITGEYQFYISADDQAMLWISTDENPANKVLVATEPIWSGFRQYTGNGAGGGGRACPGPLTCNISPPLTLQAGCKYFIEGIYKEGGGGDFMSVAWRLPGGNPPAIGSAPIQAGFLSPYEIPASIADGQPADVTATEGRIVTVSADIKGSPPMAVQWYRDGVAIPGATGFSYTFGPVLHPEDNGATFHVTASNNLAQVQSRTATLTVNEDVEPPAVVRAAGSTTLDRVTVTFDEFMDEATAEDGFNYSVIPSSGGELLVIAVDLQADRKTVVLTLDPTSPLALDTAYSVQARNVFDISGNELLEGNATFHSVVEGCGGIIFEAYNAPGNGVGALTSHPTFPNSPDFRMTIPGLDSRLAYPTDAREQYGARMRGAFVPPYSGQWVLYLRSDDASELWFNPNGLDPAGKVKVQEEPGCCRAFEALPTAAMDLIGGRPYYIEVLYKEGGGGDYAQVAARPLGSADALVPIGARDVGQYAEPGFSGSLTVNGPTDQTVEENRVATFSVAAESSLGLPICYQWYRDDAAIAGATGSSYSFLASLADNGAVFKVKASIVGNVVNSAAATLNVTADVSRPSLVSATGADSMRNVIVAFDELVDEATAEDYFNYEIAGLSVEAATLLADGRTVSLRTSEQAQGTVYTVVVNNVTDRAATPNVIAANSSANFTSFALSCGFLNFAAYDTAATPGNAVSILTSDPDFPNNPRDRAYISSFNSRDAYPDDSHEQYGGRIHGVFIPPVSGDWIFHLRSDDASELWFNAAGNDPAGALKIAEEVGCCRGFDAIASAPQSLVAGTPYYIEGLYKEGVGGDYIQVAARLSTDTTPPNNLRPIGGTSLGVYADPTGASVTIAQQPVSEQTVCLDPEAAVQPSATFSVSADHTPAGAPLSIQWQRWNGSIWVDVGATGAAYSFTPNLGDNGAKFRAAIYTLGASATSSESTVTVIQMNTEPTFNVAESHTSGEDSGTQTVPGFATDISHHSIGRVPVVFSTDFSSTPANMQLYGVAAVRNGRLELTTPLPSLNGAAAINAPTRTYESFEITWKSYIGDGGGGGADGYSVNIGDNINGDPSPTGPAEEGIPTATLNVTVDTFNNADLRNPDEGIQIEWKGQEVAFQNIPKDNPGTGVYLRKSTFVDAKLSVSSEGVATLTYDGNTITGPLPGFTGITANRVVFWARTGGASDNQWIDDVNLVAYPFDSSSQEGGQTVSFETSNNNSGLFSQQPAISPDGTLSYAAAPDANGSAVVTVVAKDTGGTACNGRDTSDPKTFTINVTPVNDCPVATPQSVQAASGKPTAINLTGTDVDGDALSGAPTSSPAHGTLAVVDGTLYYTSNPGYVGPDSFNFTVSDGTCASAPATVSIQVIPANPPVCVANVSPAECGVTFPNSGKLYAIAVDGDICLALDGSGSTDPDGDALTITWTIDETNVISGAVTSVCLAPGCHTIVMKATDGFSQCEQAIEVCVVTPSEAAEQIIALVESTTVERKNKRPLIVSLKAAKAAFETDLSVGGQMLQVFRHKVAAQIARSNPGEAATFDGAAADVIRALECSLNLPPRGDE